MNSTHPKRPKRERAQKKAENVPTSTEGSARPSSYFKKKNLSFFAGSGRKNPRPQNVAEELIPNWYNLFKINFDRRKSAK